MDASMSSCYAVPCAWSLGWPCRVASCVPGPSLAWPLVLPEDVKNFRSTEQACACVETHWRPELKASAALFFFAQAGSQPVMLQRLATPPLLSLPHLIHHCYCRTSTPWSAGPASATVSFLTAAPGAWAPRCPQHVTAHPHCKA